MGSRKCYLSLLRKSKPSSVNTISHDTKMLDAPNEGLTPEKRGDVKMIDTLAEEPTPEQGVMEIILGPRITEPDSQTTLVEKLEVFSIDL